MTVSQYESMTETDRWLDQLQAMLQQVLLYQAVQAAGGAQPEKDSPVKKKPRITTQETQTFNEPREWENKFNFLPNWVAKIKRNHRSHQESLLNEERRP